MCQKTVERIAVGFASVALLLFVCNAWMINSAQATQRDVQARQAQINDGIQLGNLNNQVVRALGAAVIEKKDEKIKALLAQHGITVSAQPNAK